MRLDRTKRPVLMKCVKKQYIVPSSLVKDFK